MRELPFLHSTRRLMLIDICMKFCEDSLRGFQVTERTRFVTDRQTDGQTDALGKTICLPTLKGGDIKSGNTIFPIISLWGFFQTLKGSLLCSWLTDLAEL